MQAANGRYGPYIICDKETRSLPEGVSPLTVTLEAALALLARPRERRRARARREPLKELGEHPETKAPVRILDGRFGPYVTDGTLNASLPRGTTVEEVTLDFGLELLAERARRGGSKKKTSRKKTSRKKTAKKAQKKTQKKTPKKTSAAKTKKKARKTRKLAKT